MCAILPVDQLAQQGFDKIRGRQERTSIDHCPLAQSNARGSFFEHPDRNLDPLLVNAYCSCWSAAPSLPVDLDTESI